MGLRDKGILGLDIGTQNIKAVKRNRSGYIEGWVKVPIPDGLIKDGYVSSEKALGGHIRRVLANNNLRGKDCSLCLPWKDVIAKVSALPKMGSDMIIENLNYELENYLPKNIEEYVIDYKVVDKHFKGEAEYWDIIAIAAEKKIIESNLMILSSAGLKLRYIDVPSNCLEKLLIYCTSGGNRQAIEEETICIVDIGAKIMGIFILNRGHYFVERVVALDSIDNSVAQSYCHRIRQAIMDVIVFYNNQNHRGGKIGKIILSGGGGTDPGLVSFLDGNMSADIELLSQWIDRDIISGGYDGSDIMFLGNAIGAAIREVPS